MLAIFLAINRLTNHHLFAYFGFTQELDTAKTEMASTLPLGFKTLFRKPMDDITEGSSIFTYNHWYLVVEKYHINKSISSNTIFIHHRVSVIFSQANWKANSWQHSWSLASRSSAPSGKDNRGAPTSARVDPPHLQPTAPQRIECVLSWINTRSFEAKISIFTSLG